MVVTLGQQYNVREKPTVILYNYINHQAQPPIITQHNHCSTWLRNSTIEPYKNRAGYGGKMSKRFWTSSSLGVPAGVTQEEGHTEFLIHLLSAVRALIFLARRIQPFLSLVDREVELRFDRSPPVGHIYIYIFLVRKIPFAGIDFTSQRVRRLHGYL